MIDEAHRLFDKVRHRLIMFDKSPAVQQRLKRCPLENRPLWADWRDFWLCLICLTGLNKIRVLENFVH